MKTYLEQLIEQIQKHELADVAASFNIFANDGQPAIVHIQNGPNLVVLIQNEDLSSLEEIKRITL